MADNKTKPTKSSVAAFRNVLTDQIKRADAKTFAKAMQLPYLDLSVRKNIRTSECFSMEFSRSASTL